MPSTLYVPQRVGFKPPAPRNANAADPRKVLLEALKKLGDKETTRILDQSPAAVMGAVTNPGDVAPGMKAGMIGALDARARAIGGNLRG